MCTHTPLTLRTGRGKAALAALLLGSLVQPAFADSQVSGEAAAAKANVQAVIGLLGTITPSINTALADTGSLTSGTDMRQASMLSGSISSLLKAKTLHAVTAAASDEVISEASMSGVTLSIAGNSIGAGFVMARATAPAGSSAFGSSEIDGLLVNGSLVGITGAPNQVIPLLGGRIVLNEQQHNSDGSMMVNAVHIIVTGVADVVLGTASAGFGSANLASLSTPTMTWSTCTPPLPSNARSYLLVAGEACAMAKQRSETA